MLCRRIEEELQEAFGAVCPGARGADLSIRPCPQPRFGDYQCNGILAWAKREGLDARRIAGEVAGRLPGPGSPCGSVEAAGPGFLNLRLRNEALERFLQEEGAPEQLAGRAERPERVVVDFSSPNVAKSMHVGHIRSTNLGDAISRILRFLGHEVITDNHIGDWGTQFGKLLVGWKEDLDRRELERDALGEMERLYRKVNRESERDPEVLERSRAELVALQAGDEANRGIWQEMIRHSRHGFDALYRRLGVEFDHALGESFYNDRLPGAGAGAQGAGAGPGERGGPDGVLRRPSLPVGQPGDDPQERRGSQLHDHRSGHRRLPGRAVEAGPDPLRDRRAPAAPLSASSSRSGAGGAPSAPPASPTCGSAPSPARTGGPSGRAAARW